MGARSGDDIEWEKLDGFISFRRRVAGIGPVRVETDTYDFHLSVIYLQQIEPALPAILGHRSEHSLATGPVIPDPFISPLGLTMTPALSERNEPSK